MLLLGLWLAGVSGCVESHAAGPDVEGDRLQWANPLATALRGQAQRASLCERAGDDLVRDLFCGANAPEFTNLVDLEDALGVHKATFGGVVGISLTANSTGLSTRSVSAINPRLCIVQLEAPPYEALALTFTRGEQTVELVVRDRSDHAFRFYLLAYRQRCNARKAGCKPGDLLTPETERNWTESTLYDEEDLQGTTLDCRPCHQPNGPGTPKFLRMQELRDPFTHWLWKSTQGGEALLSDYVAAHGDESYGGVSADAIENSHPGNLAMLVEFSGDGTPQPNEFDGTSIESEIASSAAKRGGHQPEDNAVAGTSQTWEQAYARAKRGESIPVAYHDVKVTDPRKLGAMTEAYLRYRHGELSVEALPDIRDVFPDDPKRLAELGFATEPGLDGKGVLVQACSECHNDRLDQSLSRARFSVTLSKLSRAEKDVAIARLRLPASSPLAMPPRHVRTLTDEARTRLIEALQK